MNLGYIKNVSLVFTLMFTTNSSRMNFEKLKSIPAARAVIAPVLHKENSSAPVRLPDMQLTKT